MRFIIRKFDGAGSNEEAVEGLKGLYLWLHDRDADPEYALEVLEWAIGVTRLPDFVLEVPDLQLPNIYGGERFDTWRAMT